MRCLAELAQKSEPDRQTAQVTAQADGSRLEVRQTDQESDVTTVEGARDDDRGVASDRRSERLYLGNGAR